MMDIPSIVETANNDQSSLRDDEDDMFDYNAIAKYTCFTGVFKDGLSLSFSNQKLKLNKKKKAVEPTEGTPRTTADQPSMANLDKEVDSKTRKTSGLKKSGVQKKNSIPDMTTNSQVRSLGRFICWVFILVNSRHA